MSRASFSSAAVAFVALAALASTGCQRPHPDAAPPDATSPRASSSAASAEVPAPDGHALVVANCLQCHAEEMLKQQHLTSAQWASVVKKMISWGSPVETENVAALVAHLSATYGAKAPAYEPASIGAEAAAAELSPQPDGPLAGGDAPRGARMFAERCAVCHGEKARGQIGVNLVERPLLYRGEVFARTLRAGRGRMPPQPAITDGELGDLLAYLRGLRAGG